MADLLSRRVDVFNRGFGGYNTRWARHVLPTLFPESDDAPPHLLVTCGFGSNDMAAPGEKPHVPLHEYSDNLREILRHLQRRATYVVVLTPTPVHGPTRLAYQKRMYGDKATGVLERSTEVAEQYAAAAVRVAAEVGVAVLDVHALMRADAEWPRYVGAGSASGDGLHLSLEGQRFVAKALLALLVDLMALPLDVSETPQKRILHRVAGLPVELPPGVRVDPRDYERSIEEWQAAAAKEKERR